MPPETAAARPRAASAPPVRGWARWLLALSLCLCTAAAAPILPAARDQSFVLPQDGAQAVRLEGNFEIPDGTGPLEMPIVVRPQHYVRVNGSAPAKVVTVNATSVDGTYLPGDEVALRVHFSKPVNVTGAPTLRLATGCHDESCERKEVQILTCAASAGSFALSFNGEVASNIPYDADQEVVKYMLEDLPSIDEVTVAYSDSDDTLYSGGRRACTSLGNNITITFERHSVDGVDGDLPLIVADQWNAFLDDRLHQPLGDGTHLEQDSGAYVTSYELVAGERWDDRYATFQGQGASNLTLDFVYTVQYGDLADDLAQAAAAGLEGDVRDLATGEPAALALPADDAVRGARTGTLSGLSATSAVRVRGRDVPRVLRVYSDYDDEVVGLGMDIVVLVEFSHEVTVDTSGGTPVIEMDVSPWQRYATYDPVRSTNDTLAFVITMAASDETEPLEYTSRSALQLEGGAILLTSTNPVVAASLDLPDPDAADPASLGQQTPLTVEYTTPLVVNVSVSSGADDVYRQGDAIVVDVEYSHRVSLAGDAHVLLVMDRFPVAPAIFDLPAFGSRHIAKLPTGYWLDEGSVGLRYEVNGELLTVVSVSEGNVTFAERYNGPSVNASEPVTPLYIPAVRQAWYSAGNNSNVLQFSYQIYEHDFTTDLRYNDTNALVVAADGWIRRYSSRPATPASYKLPALDKVGSIGYKYDIVVDSTVPTVIEVNSTKLAGTYGVGELIDFAVAFTHPVAVAGDDNVPALFLDTSYPHRAALYTRGSGSQVLHFEYTVQDDDLTPHLDYLHTRALSLVYGSHEGTLKHLTQTPTADVNRTLPYPGLPGSLASSSLIKLDSGAPYVTGLKAGLPDGTYGVGEVVPVLVLFSAPVVVLPDGAGNVPYLELNADAALAFTDGNGTATLRFNYTVQAGDSAAEGLAVVEGSDDVTKTTRLQLNGAAVRAADEVTRPAAVQVPAGVFAAGVVIDSVPPEVVSITTDTPDGLYGEGAFMAFEVAFDQPVVAGGALRLLLELGDDDAHAAYASGSGTDTLVFNFTVAAGQSSSDLDYASADALAGGSVLQRTTNPTTAAVLTLPEPGAPGSIGFAANIVVDTQAPYVVDVVALAAEDGEYGVAASTHLLDIYGDAPAGAYRLQYAGVDSDCIEWDARADNTSWADADGASVREIIEAMPGLALDVSVALDADAYPNGGRRYEIEIHNPDPGVLSVELTCGDVNGTVVDIRAEPQPGFADVAVRFSDYVEVDTSGGAPTLQLGAGRVAAHAASSTVQVIDVGVDASEDMYEGQFRLQYGADLVTGCINWYSADGDSEYSLRSRLLELDAVNTLGLESVAREDVGGGSRFTVTFASGKPLALAPYDNSACQPLVPSDAVAELGPTTDVVFRYTVVDGDAGALGEPVRVNLNGSVIARRGTPTAASLSLDDIAGLAGGAVTFDTQPVARVLNVSSDTPARPFGCGAGQLIDVVVTFSEEVEVAGGDPELVMADGYVAQFVGRSGSRVFTFTYVAGEDSDTGDLAPFAAATALRLPPGVTASGANLTLPEPLGLGLVINTTAPVVVDVTTPLANNTVLREGDHMDVVVTFSDVVVVSGSPRLELNTGGAAEWFQGGTTQVLDVAGTSGDFAVLYGDVQTGCVGLGNASALLRELESVSDGLVDGVSHNGEDRFTITFAGQAEAVLPATGFTGCSGDAVASRPATDEVWFRFTAEAGEEVPRIGYASRQALDLNGGSIKRSSSRPTTHANVTLPRPGSARALARPGAVFTVDSSAPVVVDVRALVSDGALGEGAVFDIEVEWDVAVVVVGTPRLAVNTGRHAQYVNGSESTVLQFRYTVNGWDSVALFDYRDARSFVDADVLAWSPNPITVANTTLPTPGARGSISYDQSVSIDDYQAARVVSVSSSLADGAYGVGQVVPLTVTFARTVNVVGSLFLGLNAGTAEYVGGSGTHALEFEYTVGDGDNATVLDTAGGSINVTAGYVSGRHGVMANLTLPDDARLSLSSQLQIDPTPPYVERVEGVTADGAFGVGDEIEFDVVFSAPVTLVAGTLTVQLDTQTDSDTLAEYVSGSGTTNLRFAHTVTVHDYTPHLDYVDINSLSLSSEDGGELKRTSTTPTTDAVLVLPHRDGSGALSANSVYIIDGEAPVAVGVSSPLANGTVLTTGDTLYLNVTFSLPVVFSNGQAPGLRIDTGAAAVRTATYVGGEGSYVLRFEYVVASGDSTAAVDVESSGFPLDVTKGALLHATTNPTTIAYLGLPVGVFSATKRITLDTTAPSVQSVESLIPDGVYGIDADVVVQVVFDLAVVVTGTPYLLLELGDEDQYAAYTGGDGTDTLTFEYTIADGDNTAALDYVDEGSLVLSREWEWVLTTPAATIKRLSSQPTELANLELPPPGAPVTVIAPRSLVGNDVAIAIDARGRIPQRVYSTLPATSYGVGQHVPIVVKFSQEVALSGVAQLRVDIGSREVLLNHTSGGNGTRFVVFSYEVAEGDSSRGLPIEYPDVYALSVLNGTLVDVSDGREVPLLLPEVGLETSGIVVDTTAPYIVGATAGGGEMGAGEDVYVSVAFSAPVFVALDANATLSTGAVAPMVNGSGTDTLLFLYTVAEGENAAVLSVEAVSGDILRLATYPTTPANLTLHEPLVLEGVEVDTAVPRVLAVRSETADGSYGVGDVLELAVDMSLPVSVVDGWPLLQLKTRGNASFVGMDGAETLRFEYAVASGDHSGDLDYLRTTSLLLNGSRVLRSATDAVTAADLELPPPGAVASLGRNADLVLDTTSAPTVVSVGSQLAAGASYGTGQDVLVVVTFSEAVTSSDASLALSTGDTARFSHGSGTEELVLVYEVAEGDSALPLDYASTRALSGTIQSAASGALAVLRLPEPGAAGSLGATAALSIVTSAPTVERVWTDAGFSEFGYGVGHELWISVRFSMPVELFGDAALAVDVGATRYANYSSGSTTDTLTFLYEVQDGDTARLLSSLELSGDVRLNSTRSQTAADLTLPVEGAPGSLSATSRVKIDTTPPQVSGVVTYLWEGEYGAGEELNVAVRFNVPVEVSGAPRLRLNAGEEAFATYDAAFLAPRPEADGRQLAFTYTIQADDFVDDLRFYNESALEVPAGAWIRRASTNPTVDADVALATDAWSMDRVRRAELLLRGLHHEWASDLTVGVSAAGRWVDVLDREGGSHSLGAPQEALMPRVEGIPSSSSRLHGVGYDYLFADGLDENLARRGLASQSSTAYGGIAARGIDGDAGGWFSGGSVTHTGFLNSNSDEPWWQVELEQESAVGTIVLWNREQEPNVDEVQTVFLESYWGDLAGTFTLNVTVGGVAAQTDEIAFDANATEVERALEALDNVFKVEVEHGTRNLDQYTWTVTFVGELQEVEQMEVGSSQLSALDEDRIKFRLATTVEANANEWYAYQEPLARLEERLFPCHVMVLPDVGEYESLEDALAAATWSTELTEVRRQSVVDVPDNVTGLVVRVQLPALAETLTIAEVQVFANQRHSLAAYNGGRIVVPTPASRPLAPAQSLSEAFVGLRMNHTWLLTVEDHEARPEVDVNERPGLVARGDVLREHGRGALSDWVLLLTDETDVVRAFYPRIVGHVVDLPKYGVLRGADGEVVAADAERTNLVLGCLGVDTTGLNGVRSDEAARYCVDNFGVARSLSSRRFGSVAVGDNAHALERVLQYEPLPGFVGEDVFSFKLSAPKTADSDVAVVRLDVRDCRARSTVRDVHPLCLCDGTEGAVGNATLCWDNVVDACDDDWDTWTPMCIECAELGSFGDATGACLVQVERAVEVVQARGWCDVEEKPVCEPEAFGARPREPLFSYATAGPGVFREHRASPNRAVPEGGGL